MEDRLRALRDSELYFDQSTGALLRALEEVPDEIVAVIPNAWAIDAADRPVATSLAVSGSNTLTMRIVKDSVPPPAYPVIAAHEVIVADSLDEWEVLQDVANASTYGGPDKVRGRGAGPYDTGLIGSDDDPYGGSQVRHFPDGKRAPERFYSNKNQVRLAFCSFRSKFKLPNRPRRCTP